jgi:hypothetical protein
MILSNSWQHWSRRLVILVELVPMLMHKGGAASAADDPAKQLATLARRLVISFLMVELVPMSMHRVVQQLVLQMILPNSWQHWQEG